MGDTTLFIGNSDGIGLATTRALLERGRRVIGISRSAAPVSHPAYVHHVADVTDVDYPALLDRVLDEHGPIDLCVYAVGIGQGFDVGDLGRDVQTFEVNLVGLVRTAAAVVPTMVERGAGHFIGLSSLADGLVSPDAPSYHASKAGFSNYIEGLALALRPKGVDVTNVRFGFVDTKMAKGPIRPFMMSVDRAARHLLRCIEIRPARYSAPRTVAIAVVLLGWLLAIRVLSIRRWPWSR